MNLGSVALAGSKNINVMSQYRGDEKMSQKMLLLMAMCVSLAIMSLTVSPIKATLSGTATSEVSIPQNASFSDKVAVSVEQHVEIAQGFSVEGSMLAQANVVEPPSPIVQIAQDAADRAISSSQEKITSYGPVFWGGNPLIESPEWSWIPAGIVGILVIIIIGRRRLSCITLKYILSSFSTCLMTF
jgi:hypothetical protein